ncbi:MAG TPA: hypothetical protein VGL99_19505 [Chloroflexota bacterium]|jgi:hypothetical protein
MRGRAHYPETRELTLDETARAAAYVEQHWPGRAIVRASVEWSRYLIVDWQPGSGPVSQLRLPLALLGQALFAPPRDTAAPSATYRQDRYGEHWHIIPVNEHGTHGRAVCGEPRQGTRLSETHAEVAPTPPEHMCPRCLERVGNASRKDSPDVRLSPALPTP